jgi:sec-independent protein translocase protein TatB|tara:strand:+ start:9439 stop:9669 length:231 start_codon:yes stop_codon:yes gene_type:complete
MIQIGIPELFIVILIALFSVKPENIQSYVKSFYRYILLIQNFFTNTKEDLEKELNIDGLKQDIHNEKRLKELDKDV